MIVTGGGISIRVAREDDAPALSAIYAPYVRKTAISFECCAPDAAEFARRIGGTLRSYPYLVAVEDGLVLGYAYAGRFSAREAYDWSAETSIYVRRDMRGNGVGRLLYTALARVLRAQGVVNLYACVACPPHGASDEYLTDASIAFHEHMGFLVVGRFERCACKFGRWYDMAWMHRSIAPCVPDQPAVRAFPQIADEVPRLLRDVATEQ